MIKGIKKQKSVQIHSERNEKKEKEKNFSTKKKKLPLNFVRYLIKRPLQPASALIEYHEWLFNGLIDPICLKFNSMRC